MNVALIINRPICLGLRFFRLVAPADNLAITILAESNLRSEARCTTPNTLKDEVGIERC